MGIASAIFCSSGSSAAAVLFGDRFLNLREVYLPVLSGSAYQCKAPDLEENVLNYAEIKALALVDPRSKNPDKQKVDISKRIFKKKSIISNKDV